MPPNLLVKRAFIVDEFDDIEPNEHKGPCGIRTDFILHNIFSHHLSNRYRSINPMNKRENAILKPLKEIVNAYRIMHDKMLKYSIRELEMSKETAGCDFIMISRTLFEEEISWNRIALYFVFVEKYLLECLSKDLPEYMADIIFDCFSRFIVGNIEEWVHDHDGWGGITSVTAIPMIRQQFNHFMNLTRELFEEGITWNRIVVYFVFVKKFLLECFCKYLPEYIADIIFKRCSRFTVANIEP